jgi:hypothetical protein
MTERNYEQEDRIDKFNLDQEWLEQGDKYIYWSKRSAQANAALENCILRRKILKAELYNEHRQNFTMDNAKFSEAMIDAAVHADPRYKTISQEEIDLREAAMIMTDVKWNFQQRQARISELQLLMQSGYYSTPQFGGKEIQENLREGLKGKLGGRRG